MAIVDDPDAKAIEADAMERGCRLMRWYLSEALQLEEKYHLSEEEIDAQTILKWARARGLRRVDAADLQKSGPHRLRRKERFDPAIEVLVAKGLFQAEAAPGKARSWRVQ